jgi:outer membrane protein insertion porin family
MLHLLYKSISNPPYSQVRPGNWLIWLELFALLLAGSACNTQKHLGPDEAFLKENVIDLKSEERIRRAGNLRSELSTLEKQRPNGKFFFFVPQQWFYYHAQDTLDRGKFSKNFRRWQMRQFGQEPRIYNRELAESTQRAMVFYMQHQGFFDAEVRFFPEHVGLRKRKIRVTYEVSMGAMYQIRSIEYESRDTALLAKVLERQQESLLKPGNPVSSDLYNQEARRITRYLRNSGYAYFQQSHIASLDGDSIGTEVDLRLEILTPYGDSIHRLYRIGNLYVYPEYDPNDPYLSRADTVREGIVFVSDIPDAYPVKPKAILNAIYLERDSIYSQDNFEKTNRQLSSLGVFRFVTIREERDPERPGVLNFHIYLSPNNRFEYGGDAEINTSNSPFIGQRLFGVAGNVTLRHRNLFRGAELLAINLEGGLGLNLDRLFRDSMINTIDLRLQSDLYFPKFIDYFGVWRAFNKTNLISDEFYRSLKERAATRVGAKVDYLENIDLYVINSFNASYGFEFRRSNKKRFQINHLGIDYLVPRTTVYFDTLILNRNTFLQRSYDKQFFTGFLLRDFSFNYTGTPNKFGQSLIFNGRFESSGAEIWTANQIFNAIVGEERAHDFSLQFQGDTIRFSQFLKLDTDFRYYKRFSEKHNFVTRFQAGLAVPYGSSPDVPYVKQFFAGGPQGIRAWNQREIGPGGYRDPLTLSADNRLFFYQTGDVKLEINAEYRFYLFTFLSIKYEGALFLDMGNVWLLNQDTSRALGQFRWNPVYDEKGVKIEDNFLQTMAVGTGTALRMDFSYFVFSLNLGFKLRNPYPTLVEDNGRIREQYWRNFNSWNWQDSNDENYWRRWLNFSFWLGYPF